MEEAAERPVDRDRLSVVLAVLVLSSVLFRFIELPEHVYRLQLLGSPLEIRANGSLLLIVLMVGLACTGTGLVLHDHPRLTRASGRRMQIGWILPGALAGLSAYLLSLAPTLGLWMVGLTVSSVGIGLTIAAENATMCSKAHSYPVARLGLNVLAYLMALVLFVLIYRTRTRSLVTATLTLMTGGLLAVDLLSVADVPVGRMLPFAGIIAMIIGQSTWALNYMQISAWTGWLLLLLVFYVAVNVAHQHLLDRLGPSMLIEFAAVALAVLLAVVIRGP